MDVNDESSPRKTTSSSGKNGGVSPGSKTTRNFIDDPGGGESQATSNKAFSSNSASLSGLLQRLLGCLRPVWTILGKASKEHKTDPWIVPFDEISELEWLGSGAQGAVFLGQYGGQQVAVKKVRREADTDIKHLRNINHPNIVKFRYEYWLVAILLTDVLKYLWGEDQLLQVYIFIYCQNKCMKI